MALYKYWLNFPKALMTGLDYSHPKIPSPLGDKHVKTKIFNPVRWG